MRRDYFYTNLILFVIIKLPYDISKGVAAKRNFQHIVYLIYRIYGTGGLNV